MKEKINEALAPGENQDRCLVLYGNVGKKLQNPEKYYKKNPSLSLRVKNLQKGVKNYHLLKKDFIIKYRHQMKQT